MCVCACTHTHTHTSLVRELRSHKLHRAAKIIIINNNNKISPKDLEVGYAGLLTKQEPIFQDIWNDHSLHPLFSAGASLFKRIIIKYVQHKMYYFNHFSGHKLLALSTFTVV